jgi:hypothetical protein
MPAWSQKDLVKYDHPGFLHRDLPNFPMQQELEFHQERPFRTLRNTKKQTSEHSQISCKPGHCVVKHAASAKLRLAASCLGDDHWWSIRPSPEVLAPSACCAPTTGVPGVLEAWQVLNSELHLNHSHWKSQKKSTILTAPGRLQPARDNFPNTTVRHVKWIDQPKEIKCLWSFSHRAKKNDVKKRAMAYSPKADFRAAEKTKDNNSNNNNKGSFYVCTRMRGCTYT